MSSNIDIVGQRQSVARFLLALHAAGAPPCDGCPMAKHCRENETACADFNHWVETSEVRTFSRVPSKDLLAFTESAAPFNAAEHSGTAREIYAALCVEAHGTYRWPPGLPPRERLLGYHRWLRERGVVLGPLAAQILAKHHGGHDLTRWFVRVTLEGETNV